MTRKSRREIENAVEDLAPDDETDEWVGVVTEHPETGEWYRSPDDEEPIGPEVAEQADPLMIITETVVETDWSASEDAV